MKFWYFYNSNACSVETKILVQKCSEWIRFRQFSLNLYLWCILKETS